VSDRLILALDTSTLRGSVAVGLPGDALARVFLDIQAEHAARLIPAINATLEQAGVERDELQGVVVGAGPGSFTGVRVAAATAKGLSHALGIPLWAFSSLAAAAATAETLSAEALGLPKPETSLPYEGGLNELPRCVLFDARAKRVYAACYRFNAEGLPDVLIPPVASELDTAIEAIQRLGIPVAFVGNAARRHQDIIRDAGFPVLESPAGEPTADGLLHLMGLQPHCAPLADPARWEPDYLRSSGAERGRT